MPYPPILVAEDSEDELILIQKALKKAQIINPVITAHDGEEVIKLLTGMGAELSETLATLPALVLLDLKMPKMTGFDVLKWIRRRPHLNKLVVIVFSSSGIKADVNTAYALHANSFLVKPGTFEDLVKLFQCLHTYWFCWNELPDCNYPTAAPQMISQKQDSQENKQ